MVQWLGLGAFTEVARVQFLVEELRSHKLCSKLVIFSSYLGVNSGCQVLDDSTFMAESEEELKSLLMKVKEETEKADLKLNIQKTKIMASGPITSWQTVGEIMETVRDFILLGSKITADGDCSHGIKRHLLLGTKAMTNLVSVLKSRDITLPTKVCLVSYGFSSSHVWI